MSKENFEFVTDRSADKTEFERSLEEFCVYDIAAPKERKPVGAGQIVFNLFRYGLILLFLGIFVYCVFAIMDKSADYLQADNIYSDLAEQFERDDFGEVAVQSEVPALVSGTPGSTLPSFEERLSGKAPEQAETATGGAVARAKVAALKAMNPDAVAWIMVDGTHISLPVVQGPDNEYYLNYAFDGSENWAGTLFIDHSNSSKVTENYNLVIYGHNMEGGQMFSDLTKFLEEDFFEANRTITLYSDEGIFTYDIFAVFKANQEDDYFHSQFEDEREFQDFMYRMKYHSMYIRDDVEFNEQDRIITLSTCTNENQRERYTVQGKLIHHEK